MVVSPHRLAAAAVAAVNVASDPRILVMVLVRVLGSLVLLTVPGRPPGAGRSCRTVIDGPDEITDVSGVRPVPGAALRRGMRSSALHQEDIEEKE